ncbi:MAG: FG-GAP-like repeat-containing protein [Persicimonas sp.]
MKIKYYLTSIALAASVAACNQSAEPGEPTEEAQTGETTDVRTIPEIRARLENVLRQPVDSVGPRSFERSLEPMDGHLEEPDALVWKHDWDYTHTGGVIFGGALASAGDVNGDGLDDFIVGTGPYLQEEDSTPHGTSFVFHGNEDGVGNAPDWSQESKQDRSWFGFDVSTAGDVNGDGYDDVIIGAPNFNDEAVSDDEEDTEDVGAFYVFHGGPDGLSDTPDFSFEISSEEGAEMGRSVASAGDLDGDGFDDVLVGVPFAQGSGAVLVFRGSDDGISETPDWGIEAPSAQSAFGWAVDGVGDVNGDGFDDFVAGAPGHTDGESGEGAIYLFLGSADGPSEEPDWHAESDVADALLGYDVSAAGDVNGDGFPDVIAGAAAYTSDEYEQEGAVYSYLSDGQTFEDTHDWMITGEREGSNLGRGISGGGDVNGDGYDDILIPDAHFGLVSFGGMLYRGSADGLEDTLAWEALFEGNSTIGDTAAIAGDLDGDGHDDLLLGAPHLAEIYVYYGAACFDADWDGYTGPSETCPDGTDCHDLADWAYPGAEEICDGLDTNCNGDVDEGCDDDGDGYCDDEMDAWVQNGLPETCPNGVGDCDDEDPDHNPGTPEDCNFRDDNCDGNVDEEPEVCGGEDIICYQGGCFGACEADADCSDGERCYDGRCSESACANVECPDRREECFGGTCQRACEIESQCQHDDGSSCIDGRCAKDPCDGVICGTEEECRDGACVDPDAVDPDAGNGDGDAGESTGSQNNSDDGGCSTTPGGRAPVGLLGLFAIGAGLLWRRRG